MRTAVARLSEAVDRLTLELTIYELPCYKVASTCRAYIQYDNHAHGSQPHLISCASLTSSTPASEDRQRITSIARPRL